MCRVAVLLLVLSSCAANRDGSGSVNVAVSQGSTLPVWRLEVAAVGDSYTSGVGGGQLSQPCGRSESSWPDLAVAEVARMRAESLVSLSNVACSGAEIADVADQLDDIGDVDVVLLTAGGNDAGFSELLATCAFGDCVAALEGAAVSVEGFSADLVALFEKSAMSANMVVVSTYPQVFDAGDGGVEACSLFTAAERAASRVFIDALNAQIRESAESVDAVSVVEPVFDGHGACSQVPWVVPPAVSGDTMHPNAAGYAEMASVVVPLLAASGS
jgi:lysophospholipase L1-like esterase